MRTAFSTFLMGALLLVGCTPPPPRPVPDPVPPVVALVIKSQTNPFFVEMEKGARRAEAEFGFTLKVKSGAQETSIDQQVVIVETLIQEQVAAIVVAPGSSADLIPVLKRAQDQGIRIVNVDNQLDPVVSEAAGLKDVPFISVDNFHGAYLAAKSLVHGINSPTKAVILEGIPESFNSARRQAGATRAFGENPHIRLVASQTAHWKIDEAYEVTKALFAKDPEIGLIFASNDLMALGAAEYLKEARLTLVRVAGYDALDQAKTAIQEGRLVASVDQQAQEQGYIACATAVRLLQGQSVARELMVEVRLVTKESLVGGP